MKISASSLPSKGLLSPIQEIDIKPLNYNQLKKYNQNHYTKIAEKICWDIECLLSDIPGYESLSIYDLKSLIFTKKYISAGFKDTINVEVDGKIRAINISDIQFKDISPEVLQMVGVVLNNEMLSFTIPTIGQVYDLLKVAGHDANFDYNRLVLICALGGSKDNFNHIAQLINKSTDPNDIVILDYLDKIINDVTKDVTVVGGGSVVNLSEVITDIFRFIRINTKLDRTKIITK